MVDVGDALITLPGAIYADASIVACYIAAADAKVYDVVVVANKEGETVSSAVATAAAAADVFAAANATAAAVSSDATTVS